MYFAGGSEGSQVWGDLMGPMDPMRVMGLYGAKSSWERTLRQ